MQAEVLIIGDSHTDTLAWGCQRLGIGYHHVRSSGGAWFEGKYGFHAKRGLIAQPGPPRKKLAAVKDAMGVKNIFDAGLPVIASFGFNLGMMMSAVKVHNQEIIGTDGTIENPAKTVLSQGFAEAYVEAKCGKNISIVKNIAKIAELTMVVPPRADVNPNRFRFVDIISDRMMAAGASIFDPSMMITNDQVKPLDPSWIRQDGVHARPEYGERAIKVLIEHQVIGRASVAA